MKARPVSISPIESNPLHSATGVVASVFTPAELGSADREAMCSLLSDYFLNVDQGHFESDLDDKEWVVVVRESENGRIRGFSTLMTLQTIVDGQSVVGLYSGDTIVDEQFRGQAELHRAWGCHVWRIAQATSHAKLYWFLVSCGYKTYRFFPLFFREFFPAFDRPMPPLIKRHLDALCEVKFGDQYAQATGVIRFANATPLRPEAAVISPQRLSDPHVAFYVGANAGHVAGHGLACLAEITRDNLTTAAFRMLAERR
jgi:hypothetical protein